MESVEINSDMGEGFGLYRMGDDRALMPFIDAANVACGFRAADPMVMRRPAAHALHSFRHTERARGRRVPVRAPGRERPHQGPAAMNSSDALRFLPKPER